MVDLVKHLISLMTERKNKDSITEASTASTTAHQDQLELRRRDQLTPQERQPEQTTRIISSLCGQSVQLLAWSTTALLPAQKDINHL